MCTAAMTVAGGSVRCAAGHAFDIARQGYLNLLPGDARPGTADTTAMVQARRAFLESGHYRPLTAMVAEQVAATLRDDDLVVDAGGGTGHYLRAVLDRSPGGRGVTLDLSKYAARHAARAHPRAAALVADLWRPLPLQSASAAFVLNIFAPRNAAEYHRILRPGGILLVVTPGPRHLTELVHTLGLITVDEHKAERLQDAVGKHFRSIGYEECTFRMRLSPLDIERAAEMGPSARHVSTEQLADRIGRIGGPIEVTAAFHLSTFAR